MLLPVLAALLSQARAAGPASGEEPAAALVRVLRIEPIFVASIRYNLLNNEQAAKLPESVRDCLAGVDLSFAHDMYVEVVTQVMTPAEIATAIEYYQSHAGYMNLMISLRKHRDVMQGNPLIAEADAAGEASEEDLRQMKAFAASPLGGKIGQIHTEQRKEQLAGIVAQKMAAQCLPQP